MKAQFDQQLLSSFYLWFENQLLSEDFSAYHSSIPCEFKHAEYPDLPSDLIGYAGEFRQLVADSGISDPMTGLSVDGSDVSLDPIANGGLYMDYNNGRILMPVDSGIDLTITGEVAVKEVNTYLSNDDDVELIIHSDFIEEGATEPYFYDKAINLDKNVYFLPACFISLVSSDNEEFCFGGEEETMNKMRVLVLTKDNFILESLMSKFRDTARENIPLIPYEDSPYGFEFTLKSYPYGYSELAENSAANEFAYIERVKSSKMDWEELRENINKHFSVAFIDFDLSTRRFPRV